MAGYIGSKAAVVTPGAERIKTYAITSTTTVLTGLVYSPGFVHVFHNGVRLTNTTDYTATDGSTITLLTAAQNGDEVVVVSYATFQIADTVSASAGGTFQNAVSFFAGSASIPGISVTGDTNTGIFFPAADTIAFSEGGAESMRITSSGNVGIGTTSPASSTGASVDASGPHIARGFINDHQTSAAVLELNGNKASVRAYGATAGTGFIAFNTGGGGGSADTERARIDASGNLLVGTTSTFDSVSFLIAQFLGGLSTKINNTAAVTQVSFFNPNGRVGFVGTSGTSTTYNTSSDYRLKENVAPMQNALDTVAQLNPVTYTWKADGSAGQGFIAHELQAVVPDCVTGAKDAVDAEGNPQYQGVDTSFLVATLVRAIQELTARVAELEAN